MPILQLMLTRWRGAAAMDLLQQQEDSTLCADLSAMMYELALCRQGLDIVCHPESVRVIVNLSNHTHEPTRACCARLLGLVMARGGVERVIQAGGEQAVCIIGMLAATLTTEVDAVGRARLGVGNLGPMPPESGGARYGESYAHDSAVVAAAAVEVQPPAAAPAASVAESYHNVAVIAAAVPSELEPAMPPPPAHAARQLQSPSYMAPPPQAPASVDLPPPPPPQASHVAAAGVPQQPPPPVAQPSLPVQGRPTARAPAPVQSSPMLPQAAAAMAASPPAEPQRAPTAEARAAAPSAASAPAAASAEEADANELLQLLEQYKLRDALAALREYGVGCVEDLRELEPAEIDGLSVTPIAKKKLHKLMVQLGVPSFLPVVVRSFPSLQPSLLHSLLTPYLPRPRSPSLSLSSLSLSRVRSPSPSLYLLSPLPISPTSVPFRCYALHVGGRTREGGGGRGRGERERERATDRVRHAFG